MASEPEIAPPPQHVPSPGGPRPGLTAPTHLGPATGPTGTVTLLFTDIAGSTELLERLRGDYATLLEDHRALLRAAFVRWKGHEVDTQGDSFFVAFSTAADAVACAVEAQRALAAQVWPQGVSVSVRMGLHTGEPIAAQTGYVGLDVHRAARVGAAAHGGQVLLTQTTRDLAAESLPADTNIRDLGEHRLKGIRQPIRIFQLEVAGLTTEFPPLRTVGQDDEPPTPGEPPYRGLQVFDEGDARLFVGREKLTERLVAALREWPLLAIVGASGSGKSSLLRAGMIPALRRDPDRDWQVHVLTPTAHPLDSLSTAMTTTRATDAAALIDDFRRDPRSLRLHVNRLLAGPDPRGGRRPPGGRVLIAIDQLEELFTLCRDDEERRRFIDNLLTAVDLAAPPAGDGATSRAAPSGALPLRVVVTLRADFYAHLAEYTGLREAIAGHQVYVGPMERAELRRAIEEPARRNGWDLVPGLSDLMLHDAGDEPGNLPLLSHALLETWRRRRGNTLTLKGYAESGGVRGAIATTAERVFMRELSPEQQRIARGIFLRLTELGQGTQDTRRRVARAELIPKEDPVRAVEVEHVIGVLADARLTTVAEDSVEVAHEALIREWPRLREWLAQDREGLLLHRRLTEAAGEWELLDRDPGALYRGARLAQAVEWAAAHADELNAVERAFLEAGQAQADAERLERESARQRELEVAQALAQAERQRAEESRRTNRRLRGLLAVAGVLLLATVGAVAYAFVRAADADRSAREEARAADQAAAAATVADAQRLGAQALVETDMDRALLLARQAVELAQTPQSEGYLLATLLRSPDLLRVYRPVEGRPQRPGGISADGRLLAVRNNRDETVLMNTESGEVVETFTNAFVEYSLDGRTLAIETEAGIVLRDRSGEEREVGHLVPEDPERIGGRVFWVLSPNADEIVGLPYGADELAFRRTDDGTVARTLHATPGHAFLDVMYAHENPNVVVTVEAPFDRGAGDFPPDAEVIFVVREGRELAPVRSIESGHPWVEALVVAPSRDGRHLVMGAEDGSVTLVDLEAATQRQIGRHNAPVRGAAFGTDLMVTTGDDRLVRIWHVETGNLVDNLAGHAGRVFGPVLISDAPGTGTIYTTSLDGSVMRWDLTSDRRLGRRFDLSSGWFLGEETPSRPAALDFGVAVVLADGTIELRDGQLDWNVEARIAPEGGQPPNAVAFADEPYPPRMAVAGPAGVTVHSPQGRATDEPLVVPTDAPATSVAFALDGRVWAGCEDGSIYAWDAERGGDPIQRLVAPSGAPDGSISVTSLDVSSDGNLLLATHGDQATVWQLDAGSRLYTVQADHDGFRAFVGTFAPDGTTFATGSADGFVRFWDAASGERVGREVKASAGHVVSLDYRPDGRTLLTGGSDGTARLIDIESQAEIGVPLPGTDNVHAYAFYFDQRNILVMQSDGSAVQWNADPSTWKQRACAVAGRTLTEEEWERFLPGRPYEPACAVP